VNLLAALMALLLNQSEPCNARPAEAQRISGMNYQVLVYQCGARQWKLWQYECKPGRYSPPFYMEETYSHQAFWVNRFGEVQYGVHATINEMDVPFCGT
jgi:hypothetical protein